MHTDIHTLQGAVALALICIGSALVLLVTAEYIKYKEGHKNDRLDLDG